MKRNKLIILFFTLFISGELFSQVIVQDSVKKESRINYFFNLQSGAICKPGDLMTFSTSTIHGIRIGRLRTGVGIGIDSYKDWQTMPLFGSASWDLFGKKNVVFTQLNYGWSKSWKHNSDNEYGFKKASGGETFSAMIGYRIACGDMRVALLAGYKFQRVQAYYEYYYYMYSYSSFYMPYPNKGEPSNTQTIRQDMNRFVMSLSVGWR